MPGDDDVPPLPEEQVPSAEQTPVGFWMEVSAAIKQELKPPASGFFSPGSPVKGVLRGGKLILECPNSFTMDMLNKPEILAVVSRKASAQLGTPITAIAVDKSGDDGKSGQMEQLLDFGRSHADIIRIKEN